MKELVKKLENTDVVICDRASKSEFLKLRNRYPYLKFKLYAIDEVISMFFGTTNEHTLFQLLVSNHIEFYNASIINENLIFAKSSDYSLKTALLSEYRNKLIEQGMIRIDPFAKNYFAYKNIVVFEAYRNHSLLNHLLTSNNGMVTYLPQKGVKIKQIRLFNTEVDEIYYVLNEVSALLEKGVESNEINLVILNNDYEQYLNFCAKQFGIGLNTNNQKLSTYPETQRFIRAISEQGFSLKILEGLASSASNVNIEIYNILTQFELDKMSDSSLLPFVKNVLDNHTYNDTQVEGIRIIKKLPQFSVNQTHFFVLGFNEGFTPVVNSDSPFLTSVERANLGMQNSDENNLIEECLFIDCLNSDNVILSSAKVVLGKRVEESSLARRLGYQFVKPSSPGIFYSQAYLNFLTGSMIDEFNNYLNVHEDYKIIVNRNKQSHLYNSYTNKYNGIRYRPETVKLSFSSLDLYQRLPFDYFVSKVLRINTFEETYAIKFGNFVHRLIEKCADKQSFDYAFDHYGAEFNFNSKEEFLNKNRIEQVRNVFSFFYDYDKYIRPTSKSLLHEYKVDLQLKPDLKFEGIIDLLYTFEHKEKEYYFVVDFKTGNIDFSPKLFENGLNLQLPLYAYVLANIDEYKHMNLAGLAYSSIKRKAVGLAEDDYEDKLYNSLKFFGVFPEDLEIIKLIDPDIEIPVKERQSYFASLRLNQNSKKLGGVTEIESIGNYITIAQDKIFETYSHIKNSFFPIIDKPMKSLRSSAYSSYLDISYLAVGENEDYLDESDTE